jgi:NSS family neurotransmitter:Na+ symporter
MPIVALLTCILIGFILKPQTLIEEVEATAPFKAKRMFTVVIKYIAPVFLVVIFLSSLLTAFGVIDI